jgi:predicted RNase H-like HicB family nuclease
VLSLRLLVLVVLASIASGGDEPRRIAASRSSTILRGAQAARPDARGEVIGVQATISCYRGDEMILHVETELEDDGRWLAEVPELPGVLAYAPTEPDARARAQALVLRVLADRLEHGEVGPEIEDISFSAA